jgi:Pyridoxamine 5'-phosphate oxidase
MGADLDEISADLAQWISRQPMFFVATAPSGDGGHVNLSPKGLAGLAILGPHRVAYLDLTGSGVETIAHLRENGRVTIMLCAFDGPPRIVRLQGHGTVHALGTDEFAALAAQFPEVPGARAIIDVEVTRVSTSCGFGVPVMEVVGSRDDLVKWATRKGDDGLAEYRATRNARSIDGLPGYPEASASERS